jgi:single-strand DNA-binding protein
MSARSLNKVMLIGNMARDPELRYTPSGAAVCSFSMATNRSWTPSDGGERKEETEFHRIVAWNKLAELCSQLLTKGRKVYIEGRLQTRSWDTPEGEKKYTTEIIAEDMVLLDSRRPEDMESSQMGRAEEVVDDKGGEKAGKKEKSPDEEKKPQTEKSDSKKEKAEKAARPEGREEKKEETKQEDDGEIDIDDIPF